MPALDHVLGGAEQRLVEVVGAGGVEGQDAHILAADPLLGRLRLQGIGALFRALADLPQRPVEPAAQRGHALSQRLGAEVAAQPARLRLGDDPDEGLLGRRLGRGRIEVGLQLRRIQELDEDLARLQPGLNLADIDAVGGDQEVIAEGVLQLRSISRCAVERGQMRLDAIDAGVALVGRLGARRTCRPLRFSQSINGPALAHQEASAGRPRQSGWPFGQARMRLGRMSHYALERLAGELRCPIGCRSCAPPSAAA
jgi:hypothetical protein